MDIELTGFIERGERLIVVLMQLWGKNYIKYTTYTVSKVEFHDKDMDNKIIITSAWALQCSVPSSENYYKLEFQVATDSFILAPAESLEG